MPTIRLISSANPSPSAIASGSGTPSLASWNVHATEIAMLATIERSMPRPITTITMAMPSTPKTATLRSSVRRFCAVRNPGSRIEKIANNKIASRKTICS